MKYSSLLIFLLIFSCSPKQEKALTLADLKKGEKAEIIAIDLPEELQADSTMHLGLIRRVGVKVGVTGVSRGPEEAERGMNYGFDIDGGNYFGLYEPHASMVKVKRLEE